ncbi:otogelin [Eublepharis macularius]|uniref:Otogelin n=1 Tax=Eublepharis macularius TaxID=481883 RepID=A0AA97IUR9_EUBMA|nr:otogelin [Eublepharis macularius]
MLITGGVTSAKSGCCCCNYQGKEPKFGTRTKRPADPPIAFHRSAVLHAHWRGEACKAEVKGAGNVRRYSLVAISAKSLGPSVLMESCFRRAKVLLYVWLPQALFSCNAAAQISPSTALSQSRNGSSAVPRKEDPSALGEQVFGTLVYNSSSTTGSSSRDRRFRTIICESPNSFTCFNGGECVHWQLCDCSRYNATGTRCQIVYNTGAERDNICRTWGQYHYETFDGLYYFFSGKSTYVLVRQNEMDEQSFSIQVHNDPECSSSHYSCKRSVSLYFSGDGEIRLSNEVTYRGTGIQLPYTIGNLYIQKLAGYVIIRHQYAFSLAWDGASAVYIKMAPDYLGKTQGLCGNNNAILQDELVTSYGTLTEDIEEFVESWRENPPQENILFWDTSFNYEPPCLTQTRAFLQRSYKLCNVLLRTPFKQCHEFVSPYPFMASCTNDLCMSAVGNATWCRALTEYARACAQAGKPLHKWRAEFEQCAVVCEEHLIYNECINCCPVSCQQKTHCVDSELPCVDGCYCPDGLIYENRLCVNPTECPCDYHGTVHRTGSVIHEECNNCTCVGGKWICTNLTCPAECSVSGDIHFMTFDGRKYEFQATCQYILAKSLTSSKFAVTLQNAPCGQNQDGACIQSVSIILDQDPKRQVTLTHSGDVLVYDQYKINLPYIDDSFEIWKLSSVFLQIKSYIGLRILYDWEGLRLYLQADARWKDNTVGLCGTFNGNTEDDFLSPVGVTESTPQLFGNAWKTSSACGPEHDSSSPVDPCDVHLQAASYSTEACSVITKDLFATCFSYLSPLPYFEQCRRDTCKCGQICMCSALAHYAHQCRRFGVVIDFRSNVPECALSCEDTKEYSTCVSTCGKTCQALSMPETCRGDCAEGCTCPPGMYLNSKTDRCVQQSECPCYFQGIVYPPGEKIVTSFGKCHCRDGVMSCEDSNIVRDCPDEQIYVNCSNPQTMELGRERTCENQLLNLSIFTHLPCFSGCICPQGLVKHGDTCFKPDECPCSWKGKEYFPGDKVVSSCHTCICHHGSFECTFHPCPSMCTTYGDRHYRTFDGLSFDYIGNCKVYLVKSSSVTSFSVIIENLNCFNTGIICRKYIFINVGKSFIIFDDDTGDPSPLSYIDKLQQIHIWKAGFFTLVHFPHEHITVMWDQRTTLHVQTGPQWQGELTGLCGNFDSKTVNEMRTPENFELTNAQEFGSSWAAVECVDSSDIRHPCILNPLREPFAKKECGILLSEVFESCHPVVDVTWFYSNCLMDTCGCNQGGDCECFCTSVSAYAHQCCQQGVTVDWRSPRLCPYDCEYANKVLGRGPYKLVSYLDREVVITAKLLDGSVFLTKGDGISSGESVNFMLTSGLYKPKAHDPNLVSFETADRPNYFLHLASSGTLVLSKWERSESFHNRSTFAIHKNTWLQGYSSFESFAVQGAFISISGSSVNVVKYQHSEAFRLSTLFKLVDTKFNPAAHSTCEWRYDVCTSPCFQTCRDPLAEHCQAVPKVEGCVPMCPSYMVLDEVTQRCVYFEDSTTSKPDILSTKFSVYSPLIQLNQTEHVTALQTQYPAVTHTITAIPSSTKVISKMTVLPESPILTTASQKTSTEYKAPLFLKTTKMGAVPQPVSVTKSDFTKEFTDKAVTGLLVTKKIEAVQITGYSFSPDTMTTGLGTTQSEKLTSLPTTKPPATLIPTSLVTPFPEARATVAATLQPKTTKTTSFFSVFPLTTELRGTVASRSTPELTALNDTGVTLSPYTEFSSQLVTVKEVASTKGISTFSTSITFPLTSLSTTLYLAKTTVSPYTLTRKMPEIPATAKQPIETKMPSTTPEATHSVPTSPLERVFSHVKEEFSVPYLMTKTTGKDDFSSASKAYLTTKGTTTGYQFSAEVAKTSIHPKSAFSTIESAVKVETLFPLQSTLEPVVAPSAISVISVFSTKVPLTSKKEIPQTAKADTGLRTTLLTSTRKTTDLISTKRPLFATSKVTALSETSSPTTKQALNLTKSSTLSESTLSSFFTLEASETSAVSQTELQVGAFLTPGISTTITSLGKSATEKISVSKQVPHSAVSYSSTLPTQTTPHFTTESAPLEISSLTTQGVTKSLAEKTAGIREPITTSLFSVSSVALETKSVSSTVAETDRQALLTKLPELHLPSKQSPSFPSLGPTSLTTTLETPSAVEVLTSSPSSLPVLLVFPNATSIPTYLSTKPIYKSTTENSTELTTVEAASAVTASLITPSRETATLPACVPISENECIKYICLDGQLIQVNKSQNCPYNATQPSCGFLGFAVQINGDKCCPKWECACRCTFFSDLSYITFDGHHLALFKEASYIITQNSDETISIHVTACRNMHMGILASNKLCLASLNLTYSSNQIIVDHLNRKIAVNSRYAWPTVRKYGFKIEDTGFMYFIETPTSIKIQWFHTTGLMVIQLNATSDPKANGLCGFCDGNSANDLMLPNRTVVSSVDASVIFTDSWQVPDTLKYVGESRSRETNCSITDCSSCINMLLNQTFSSCHPYVSPDSFCDLWVQDTEYIQNPCVALAAYVSMCNKFNICIEWRHSNYCPLPCSEGLLYKACISACNAPITCQNMDPVPQDSESCLILTEGCVCAEGTILHRAHSALCIPEEKCACTDISGVPRALGETWKTSLSGCCMYKCVDNETITPVEYNCSVSHDAECKHFGEVALIVPDDQTCCPQKVCTCNQSLCETFIPECKSLEKLATYYRDDSCCPSYTCECDPAKCESMEQIPNCQPDQTLIAAHVEGTCCVSYICACGVCSDQIPRCQEGEVLTVDGNTTDKCCPSYQCVCETYRCPEFKCVFGMSLVEVWSPEKCCPYRTCECACDTISRPQCKLGEKLIIDEQFQNSTENVCHCTKYKCCKDKVCLNHERGVLLPGQSIVEHTPDGVCYTSYCTNVIDPVTKYFRINTASVDCAARCKSNQIYEPPKDLTTCCGQCKNISCVHTFSNGTVSLFKPGTSWVSNCVRYDCTNTPVGPVLITSSISCPPFNETECVKVGGYIVPFLDGCCKTCKEDGKFCKKVTVRMTIRKNDCRSNTPVNIVSCDGKCPSASIYNYNINTYARFCKCCRELGLHRRNVQLYCSSNSTWVSYTIQEPTDCSCQWS